MALVKCPKCRAELDLDDQYLGQEVDCGSCGAPFVAKVDAPPPLPREREQADEDDFSLPPSRRRSRYDDDDDDDYERPSRRRRQGRQPDLEYAQSLIRPPALALMISAIIGLVIRVLDLVATLFLGGMMLGGVGPFGPPGGPGGPPPPGAPNQGGMVAQLASGVLTDVFTITMSILVIVACLRMMKLKGYGLSVTACILSMLPCSGCCLLGLPFAIWTLVVLNKPEVREGFNWVLSGTRDDE